MMWGMKEGTLMSVPHGYRQQVCFYFDPAFVREGLDIAPLEGSDKRRGGAEFWDVPARHIS